MANPHWPELGERELSDEGRAALIERVGKPRIAHPLAHRHGEPVTEVCRARRGIPQEPIWMDWVGGFPPMQNGNALLEFPDGARVVAPWRAALPLGDA